MNRTSIHRTVSRVALLSSLAALTLASSFAGLVACDSGGSDSSVDWLRSPLEVAWLPSDPPRVLYTVSVDSRDDHTTILYVSDPDGPIAFDQAAASDANGNAPAVPGTEVIRSYWLWSPAALVVGERTHVFAIKEDATGERSLRHVTWAGSEQDASEAGCGGTGTRNVVSYDARPCGDDVCVVLARAAAADGPTDVTLLRCTEAGERVGDPVAVAQVDGLVRSVHLAPRPQKGDVPATSADAVAVSCEGCDTIGFDDYEESAYGVTSRIVHVTVPLDGADAPSPTTLMEWGGLVERTTAAETDDGLALLYWRTASPDAPGCTGQGHCPIDRDLVPATWSRTDGTFAEGSSLATSELGYLQTVTRSADRLWALWRTPNAADPFLRDLRFAEVSEEAVASTLTSTYTALADRSNYSRSPAAVPFDYIDGLAAIATDDGGPRVAMRYRDLEPGGSEVCGETVRVGIWTAQLTSDGLVTSENGDRAKLAEKSSCGDSSCAGSVTGPQRTATPFAVLLLASLAFAGVLRGRHPAARR